MSIPPLLETQLGKYYDLKEKKEKKTAFSQKKKKKRNLLNYLANGSNTMANSAGRRRLPEPGVWR